MKTSQDYFIFDLPAYTYFNYIHVGQSPRIKYHDVYITDGWYCRFEYGKNAIVRVPKEAWLKPGQIFFELIRKNNLEFTDYLFNIYRAIVPLAEKVEAINFDEMETGELSPLESYYPEYRELFPYVIGFGCPLDAVFEEYVKENSIDLATVPVYGESFLRREERELQIIARGDPAVLSPKLEVHARKYSYLFNNYTGYHEVPLSYFQDRLREVRKKNMDEPLHAEFQKPTSIEEWIGFATYVRDQRKKCNMIVNGLLDRQLQTQCRNLSLSYNHAVLLTPKEFEAQKQDGLRDYNVRYVYGDRDGIVDISKGEWDALISDKSQGVQNFIYGSIASKGRVQGKVKVVMNPDEFDKVSSGDILVTTMTTPNYAPILGKVSAIVTNTGGITCHAAIISRELNIPCIISTGNATEILCDDDVVEVDASNGVVRVLRRTNNEKK